MLFRVASLGLGSLLGLVLAELIVRGVGFEPVRIPTKRVLYRESQPSVKFHCYSSNPHGDFRPVPDLDQGTWHLETYTFEPRPVPLGRIDETPWCVKYELSSRGIRDREYAPEPAEDVVRVACVGDSFVFGEGVPIEKTLPRQIERRLGEPYQVINGGQVGVNTEQELTVLSKLVEQAHCRRAIFVFIPNDVVLTHRLLDRQKYINDLIVFRQTYLQEYESDAWYTGHLQLFRLVGGAWTRRRIKQETIQWYLDSYDPDHNRSNLRMLEAAIHSLAEIPNCRVAFVLYPLLVDLEENYPLAPIHRKVAAMAREAGLPVLDLAPVFAGRQAESLWVHPSDRHPNGKAHALATEAVVEWLHQEEPEFLKPPSADEPPRE